MGAIKYWLGDIGELGWSLYVTGYANYLAEQGHEVIVLTSKDREALYSVPTFIFDDKLLSNFNNLPADCWGRHGSNSRETKAIITQWAQNNIPNFSFYQLPPIFSFGYVKRELILSKLLFKRLESNVINSIPRIIIFPRYRTSQQHAFRNLTKSFYIKLINKLGDEFPFYTITTIGVPNGAYIIDNSEVTIKRYDNQVNREMSIAKMLSFLAFSIVAIGGTSAPQKIANIQGVPSFTIGHEKERFMKEEKWGEAEVGFYDVGDAKNYQTFNEEHCINEIIQFIQLNK